MPPPPALSQSSPSPSGRFVCSWCDEPIREDDRREPGPDAPSENFGICASCLDTALARLSARKPARSAPRPRSKAALRAAR